MMAGEIYVVFTDQTDLQWLKFLRRGYRHCYVLMCFNGVWIAVDPLLHKTEIMRIEVPESFSLVAWIEEQGDRIIKVAPALESPCLCLLPPLSCVGSVKRILGLGAGATHIVTPWQLYKFLTSQQINMKG